MSTWVHAAPSYERMPRRTFWELARTGGQWYLNRVWRSCIHYVKRSNAWPSPILEGPAWQRRPAAPEDSSTLSAGR